MKRSIGFISRSKRALCMEIKRKPPFNRLTPTTRLFGLLSNSGRAHAGKAWYLIPPTRYGICNAAYTYRKRYNLIQFPWTKLCYLHNRRPRRQKGALNHINAARVSTRKECVISFESFRWSIKWITERSLMLQEQISERRSVWWNMHGFYLDIGALVRIFCVIQQK